MAIPKAPFKIIRNFLSPKLCEQFCDTIGFFDADIDADGNPIRMFKYNEMIEEAIFARLQVLVPALESHYEIQYKGTERIQVEWYTEGVKAKPQCENSQYARGKWVRTYNRDLSAVLFFSDYQDQLPFDSDYEVFGGKLEFPQHAFSFNPIRGTLIVYPSVPHFINAISEIQAGELYLARIHMTATAPFLYNPEKYPGNYTTWFNEL
jgi:hypothetical protein